MKKGVLTKMRSLDGGKPRKRSLVRKVGEWIIGGLVVAALIVMLVAIVGQMFNPHQGERKAEGDFEIVSLEPPPPNTPGRKDVLLDALVKIEGHPVRLFVKADRKDTVAVGKRVHVRYTYMLASGTVRVEEWRVLP